MMRYVYFAGLAPHFLAAAVSAGISGSQVISYASGDAPENFQDSHAALGDFNGDTFYGAVNPFNPPFDPGDIVVVGEGGHLTLRLSDPIPANGRHLGVFVNNGYIDITGGDGHTGSPIETFVSPQFPSAIVSVSGNGIDWKPLNSGKAVTFTSPSNAYLDSPFHFNQEPGELPANPAKPYLGGAADLENMSYNQIRTALNGSAGGDWLDLRDTSLPAVQYVRFEVPDGAGRMVVDAVSGLPAASPIEAGKPVISLAVDSNAAARSIGSGANTSNIVIDFGPQSYQFQIHYDEPITGLEALQRLAEQTPYELTTDGDFVVGHDFGGYEFIGDGSGDNDFWSYYLGDGDAWDFAGVGPGGRWLTDGSYDGWAWTPDQPVAPDLPIAIPEPSALTALLGGILLLRRRNRQAADREGMSCP